MRTSLVASTVLGTLLTLLAAATAAVAMPPPPDPTGPLYGPPVQPAEATVTSTPLWPYLVVAAAAVVITLACVALINTARQRGRLRVRHA